MDRQLILASNEAVIQLAGEGIVLAVLVIADLAVLDHLIEDEVSQFIGDGVGLDLGILDLLLRRPFLRR